MVKGFNQLEAQYQTTTHGCPFPAFSSLLSRDRGQTLVRGCTLHPLCILPLSNYHFGSIDICVPNIVS